MISILTILSVILFYFYGKRIFASDEQEEIFDKKVKKIKKETSDALDRFYCFALKWIFILGFGALFVWIFGVSFTIGFAFLLLFMNMESDFRNARENELDAIKARLSRLE